MTYPFEYLKTGLQLQPRGTAFEIILPQVKSYFVGCSALNIAALGKTILRFVTFDKLCHSLNNNIDNNDNFQRLAGPKLLVAGTLTGMVESLFIIPFENVKTTMIQSALVDNKTQIKAQPSANAKPTFHKLTAKATPVARIEKLLPTVKHMYQTRGLSAFVQGTTPTLFRQIANTSIQFTAYTAFRRLLQGRNDKASSVITGLTTSFTLVVMTQPIDVVKTQMMSQNARTEYKNTLNCMYRIFVQEGIAAFWKGSIFRFMKVGISGGLTFAVYEQVCLSLGFSSRS
ncbi:YFR045W [Saccharomyces arboricola H-6]|uniref:YFR045W n=1 Tax=Saccharomyces arboricola (strain H-6 / AS 2.3317 / CBS 10644) TaxID=1160507 RepID=J8PP08_SACAR|nr:YFR045W [Saccharomyces arboricola H-6]